MHQPTSVLVAPERVARLALLIGGGGLLAGWLLLFLVPQRPDGDGTAIALFEAGTAGPWHGVGDALWFNLAGALVAFGAFDRWLRTLVRIARRRAGRAQLLFWTGLLIAWCGWAWNQTRGWEGELFTAPGVTVPVGVDGEPRLTFSHFRHPPAPDGPGRALALRLLVNGEPHDIEVEQGYRAAGWTITPHWYGATVRADRLEAPLFFGLSGRREVELRDGRTATITVDVERLQAGAVPPLPSLRLRHHAVLKARFAPGDRLLWAGLLLMVPGLFLLLCQGRYNGGRSNVQLP